MPPPMMPAMPPPPNGGQSEMPTCPCCGQPMPMPFNRTGGPQMGMPPAMGQDDGTSELLAMLMGGMGGGGGGMGGGGMPPPMGY